MPTVAPGEGERRAIGGYHAQYLTSASLILRDLRYGRLQWIRVADPKAGRVDDLLIGSPGRVDAYQVKSAQYGRPFTFRDLTVPQSGAPALIQQLAQGWQTLKQRYGQSRVVVHLVTNQIASGMNAALPIGDPPPTPKHFAAFIRQAWEPARETSPDASLSIPLEWQTTWNAVHSASDLSQADFEAFVRDCSLEFGFEAGALFQGGSSLDQQFVEDDVDRITSVLFATVADPEHIIELTDVQLLQRLNWTERFEYRNAHRFPVVEKTYREIRDTALALTRAIEKLPGGYIAVLGAPGSGKSTLLTQHLRRVDARVIKYYAYVPGAAGSRTTRGEATNFLHDVVLQLEYAGFSFGHSPSRFDRDQLLERFHAQLHLLHQDWQATGCKTIILVDGLDHIEREQHPGRSLLADLPDPDQVPEGVYFVLGSQTDAPLSGQIKAEVRRQDRKVEMLPLSRQQVHEIISAADIPTPVTLEQRDRVCELCNGHPLYLNYLINRMRLCEGEERLELELQGGTPYEGDIEGTYHSYWEQFQDDVELQKLLGLLARIRGCIDLSWVRTWADHHVVQRLGQRFAHYFRIEHNTRWYFFHNSFRLFLIDKTAEFPPGHFDENRDRDFHAELAYRCAGSSPDHGVWVWEELHHRVAANQHDKVLALATQGYFRSQLMAFRPLEAIKGDINAALRSVAARQDPGALVRLCLIGSEMSQRSEHLDQGSLVPLLLRLGQYDVALEYIRSSVRVYGDEGVALGAVPLLMEQGLTTEARQVFGVAEPIVLLTGSMATGLPRTRVSYGRLRDWIMAALWFNDADEIVASINGLQYEDDYVGLMARGGSERSLRTDLLSDAGLEMLRQKRWSDLVGLLDALDATGEEGALAKFQLLVHAFRNRYQAGDIARAQEHFDGMLEIDRDCLGPAERVALAEALFLVKRDDRQARQLLEGLPEPDAQMRLSFVEETLRPFAPLLLRSRLDYLLGDRRTPNDIVPESHDPKSEGEILLQRAVCTVGQIWAKAWTGQKYDASSVKLVAQPMLRLHSRPLQETFSWSAGHTFRVLRIPVYELLIDAVSEHGQQALSGLHDLFELEWHEPDLQEYWPVDVRRSIIGSFLYKGCSKRWAASALRELDGSVPDPSGVDNRVEECVKHAEAWFKAGSRERAQHFLGLAVEVGFGVGYRNDYQMNQWIDWLDKINEVEPEKAGGRISHFARAIRDLDESTERETVVSAAEHLIATTFHWSPTRATQLFLWFADQWAVNYWKGMGSLLAEALKHPNPPTRATLLATSEFLLPFDTIGNTELMTSLAELLGDTEQEDRAISEIHRLISKVHRDASPSMRPTWFRGLSAGIDKTGLPNGIFTVDANDLKVEDNREGRYRSDQLTLSRDGEILDYQEVQERIKSVSDLAELLGQEAERSLFNWVPLVTQVISSQSDQGTLAELAGLFRNRRSGNRIIAEVGRRLAELGEEGSAWKMGKASLELSSGYDWLSRAGSGIKVDVFRALSCLDQERANALVYEYLAHDLEDTAGLTKEIPDLLADILDLVEPTATVRDVWTEVEDHTSSLLGYSWSDPPTDVFSGEVSDDTPHKAIVELIAAQLGHPCVEMAQAAQRCLGQLLLDRASDVSDVLSKALDQSDERRESVLMLIDSVSSIDPSAVSQFRETVCGFTVSASGLTRVMSRAIVRNCGWPEPATSRIFLPVPPIYSSIRLALNQELVRKVAPYDQKLKLISEVADVPVGNLHRRVEDIMHQIAPRETEWPDKAERRMGSQLMSVGIQLPYTKPRAYIARSAMFRAVAELVDGGRISPQRNDLLEKLLRTYDPRMVLEQPTRRPAQIRRAMETAPGEKAEDWVQNVDNALSSTDWMPDDQRIVVGEASNLIIRRDRRSMTETRYSVLNAGNLALLSLEENPESMFGGVVRKHISEYPSLLDYSGRSKLVLRHTADWVDSPGGNWLALNPAIAIRLGWSIAVDGIFRWVDDQGRVMVESIWWMDGRPMLHADGLPEDEVGEGWLVLASESALGQIEEAFGSLSRRSAVVRRYESGSEAIECRATS